MPTPTLAAHLNHLRMRDLVQTHIRCRQRAIERLAVSLGHDADTATPDELLAYVGRIPRSTPRSRYAEISHLRNYYGWAVTHGHLTVDPSRMLPSPRLSRLLPRPMSETDCKIAIDNAPARVRVWLILAAFQGLRACEIAALQRADVLDTAPTPVLVAHGKGRKDRVVPMGERAIAELRAYGMPNRGPLFPRLDGAPGATSAHRVSTISNAYLRDVGIADTLHSLRHRAATQWYEANPDILVVGALLGHEDPATTAGYAAYSDARAAATVRALDGTFAR